jgi:hypothetical protein
MVDVICPRIFRSKFSFHTLFFVTHQFQNPVVLVFTEPETMFGTAIKL